MNYIDIPLLAESGQAAPLGATLRSVLLCPLAWSMLCFAAGLFLVLPSYAMAQAAGATGFFQRLRFVPRAIAGRLALTSGALLLALSIGLLGAYLPLLGEAADWPDWIVPQVMFWLLAATTLGAALATVSSRVPVYSAIWFALTLLGVAGLLLVHGALFLGVATLVVYAGAILVMFLFVLMLAQPHGREIYDRVSWGRPAVSFAVIAGALIVGGAAYKLADADDSALAEAVQPAAPAYGDPASEHYMATLGGVLFSQHLVSIEVAGALLLVALVGAIAIVIQGRQRQEIDAAAAQGNGRPTRE